MEGNKKVTQIIYAYMQIGPSSLIDSAIELNIFMLQNVAILMHTSKILLWGQYIYINLTYFYRIMSTQHSSNLNYRNMGLGE